MNYRKRNKGIRFCGSKGKCGEIVQIIQELIPTSNGVYWEPFLGAAKIMQSIHCGKRYGTDSDPHIVSLLSHIQNGWIPPTSISEEEYKLWMGRRKKEKYQYDPMMGFVGYGCSFGARYFQGYARSKKGEVNFAASARTALLRQKPFLKNVIFGHGDYRKVDAPKCEEMLIYCDPPYEGTKPVGGMKPFNNKKFWSWAVSKAHDHIVLVSEYQCPIDCAVVIWEKSVAAGIRFGTKGDGGGIGSGKRKLEKLFCINPEHAKGVGLGLF